MKGLLTIMILILLIHQEKNEFKLSVKTTTIKKEQKIEKGESYICSLERKVGEKCFIDNKELIVVDNLSLRELVKDKKDLTNLYTSKVTDLSFLFFKDKEFNQDISNWDVSNVSNMQFMFFGAESFNQDINDWDISNVRNMAYIFKGAKSFDNLIVWNLKNVKDKRKMFDKKKSEDLLVLEGDNFIVSLGSYKGNNRK